MSAESSPSPITFEHTYTCSHCKGQHNGLQHGDICPFCGVAFEAFKRSGQGGNETVCVASMIHALCKHRLGCTSRAGCMMDSGNGGTCKAYLPDGADEPKLKGPGNATLQKGRRA